MADLFISYRRGDSAYALLLYDRLSASFDRDRVFRDFEAIDPGEYFDEAIASELKRCRAVVVVIGPEWTRQRPQLQDRQDWVRREIADAIKLRKRLFPVLVGGVKMPGPGKLPRDVADLARANAVTLSDATFHGDVDALVTALGRVVPARAHVAERSVDSRHAMATQLLRGQVARLQVRAVELIEENKVDRAIDELTAGHELLMLLMQWSPAEVILDVQLGYLYKTLGQAFHAAGDRAHADRYIDLAASTFERVRSRASGERIDADAIASAINGLGNVYAERGQPDRALAMYRAATDLVPTYAYAWHDMFAALDQKARAGERPDVPAMRQALEHAKRTGAGLPGLGATYLAQLQAALDQWAKKGALTSGALKRAGLRSHTSPRARSRCADGTSPRGRFRT